MEPRPPEPSPRAADAELLALMREGRSSAFATLMRSNNRRLYRLARGILDDDAEAEEAVQESYVRAFTHLGGFKGESSLATWLARIVCNEALGRLRRRRPTVDLDDVSDTLAADGEGGAIAEEAINPEHAVARHEIQRAIEAAVAALPSSFRAVFMMRAIEQMSIEETATCLGIPPDTVKTRFHRANRLLRQALSAQFAAILDGAFPFAGARCDDLMSRVLERLPPGIVEPFPETKVLAPESDRPASLRSKA
jgi:RNA polymerase sigma-70 factor (ECF subfamily)